METALLRYKLQSLMGASVDEVAAKRVVAWCSWLKLWRAPSLGIFRPSQNSGHATVDSARPQVSTLSTCTAIYYAFDDPCRPRDKTLKGNELPAGHEL